VLDDVLKSDEKNKIQFTQTKLDFNEHEWSVKNLREMIKENRGKRSVGTIRQEQIDATDTEYFMVLDGDEVYYNETAKQIPQFIKQMKTNICGFMPLTWYVNENQIHYCYSPVGRIFKTDRIIMNGNSPNEMHCDIQTHKPISLQDNNVTEFITLGFAHFEKWVKPWRRDVIAFPDQRGLPEIMTKNKKYITGFNKISKVKTKLKKKSNKG